MAPLLQLVSLNKRSAMLLDRLMYNLKEIMKKPPVKDGSSDKESSVKFIYSEKAAKFCEIFPLLLTTVHTVKSRVKISQNFVALRIYELYKLLVTRGLDNNVFYITLFTRCTHCFVQGIKVAREITTSI